ncbi:hypothetical protein CLAFUW4_09494 [Fulvia fulva]|uniref:F-box domain-containing protein n=1 Tax=Passalora fulva TaxID=5499 RepID=A0A9Q8PFR2_PASFU|nr:uncharacterized protein CLAFUR5_09591 [Fulvia fulva]KAK4613801.1 hypothetical protein CLAFUR4_09500 [Fulvia fulva]UJO21666.1 hypothetical protein CLAFUR5_09591 [Fulvia fulva]WPV20127.1 hypothetical protein CLAFUW4_09494 [Fulvia fulva]WPV35509.1 hypothetical protein CLAFUW7_09495 [Fulvia fulva]
MSHLTSASSISTTSSQHLLAITTTTTTIMFKRKFGSTSEDIEEEGAMHQDKKSKQEHHVPNPQATLLGLPGELRNRIYRLALFEENRIKIDATNHTLPPLLRTCRQIRNEATSIHLKENRFGIVIHNLYPQAPVASSGHWYVKTKYTVSWSGVANWENLKAWMKLRYNHELCGAKASNSPVNLVLSGAAGGASKMVKLMRAKGLTWDDIEPMLEEYKLGVEHSHGQMQFWR